MPTVCSTFAASRILLPLVFVVFSRPLISKRQVVYVFTPPLGGVIVNDPCVVAGAYTILPAGSPVNRFIQLIVLPFVVASERVSGIEYIIFGTPVLYVSLAKTSAASSVVRVVRLFTVPVPLIVLMLDVRVVRLFAVVEVLPVRISVMSDVRVPRFVVYGAAPRRDARLVILALVE